MRAAGRDIRGKLSVTVATGLASVLIVAPAQPAQADSRPLTVPALQSWAPSSGKWQLGPNARIVIRTANLLGEAEQLASDVHALTGRALTVDPTPAARAARGDIKLALAKPDAELGAEGYALKVGGTFAISAPTTTGVFYGGRTLLQLLRRGTSVPHGSARDWPRYSQRGLMLDAARTAYSRAFIEGQIARLAYLKENILHIHLTDDQRWGIQSDTHPEIVAPDALSKADIGDILAMAARYHVQVIPEIDLPGHSAALLAKHPDLELKLEGAYTTESPETYVTDKLDIGNPAALAMVKQLLDEYLPLFPGRYWDLGDDEYLSPAQYPLYPTLAAYAETTYGPGATPGDAIHGFINWADGIARSYGKTLRVWNDQLNLGPLVPVNPDVTVDWWIDVSPLGDTLTVPPFLLVGEGHDILNAGWFPTYYAGDLGPIEGKSNMQQAYESWEVNEFCDPEYTGDTRVSPCTTVEAGDPHLLGSQINVWGPLPETPDETAAGIWPRLAVISQKTWNSPVLSRSYAGFQEILSAVGQP
jgi:hexosaminidase